MLKIQEFLLSHPTDWDKLLAAAPYNLTIQQKDNLVLFKYRMGMSDFNEEICCEARGLILEKNTWKVVRMAFKKFFNIGEHCAAAIDWNSATATEKMDGSLISLYYYNNKWNIATNGSISAEDASTENLLYPNFALLFKKALEEVSPHFDYNKLNKNYTYTFELCSPYNKIVCYYPNFCLYLICVRDKNTLEELELKEISKEIEVPMPTFYFNKSEEDFKRLVENLGENKEGIVIVDKNYNRVKLKTELYFTLHHLGNNHNVELKYILKLILDKDTEEFLSYFPEYKEIFEEVENKYNNRLKEIEKVKVEVKNWQDNNLMENRKDFSIFVNKTFPKDLAYAAYLCYDNKLDSFIENLNINALIKFLNLKEN